MGLDINYYTKVTYDRDNQDDDYDGYETGLTPLWANTGCRDRSDGLKPGWYQTESRQSFRAGSYSGYNEWRNELAKCMLGMTDRQIWELSEDVEPERPFIELINFSDCEGFIGPKTSAKLAADFAAHDEKAKKHSDEMHDDWFYDKYQEWRQAFEAAANHGVVKFC